MGDIGNMHTHLPSSAFHHPDRQGIIKVLGILWVDGTGEHIAEVLTAGYLLCRNLCLELLGCFLHTLRILVRQAILRQDGMHLGIVVTRLPQDVHHGADDVPVLRVRPLVNLHHNFVVGLPPLQLALGDDDVVNEGRLLRNEEGHILLHAQLSHHGVVGPLHDLYHQCLLDMLVATGHIRHLHPVAVHRPHRVALSHKHGRAPIVGLEGVAPAGLAAEGAFLQLGLEVQPIGVVAHLQQEVIPRHLLHHVDGEHLQRVGVQLERLEYLFHRERLVRMMLEEVLQQLAHLLLP